MTGVMGDVLVRTLNPQPLGQNTLVPMVLKVSTPVTCPASHGEEHTILPADSMTSGPRVDFSADREHGYGADGT